jgi:hypothetical protein
MQFKQFRLGKYLDLVLIMVFKNHIIKKKGDCLTNNSPFFI